MLIIDIMKRQVKFYDLKPGDVNRNSLTNSNSFDQIY